MPDDAVCTCGKPYPADTDPHEWKPAVEVTSEGRDTMTASEYLCQTCGRHKPCRHCDDPTDALTEALAAELNRHERRESRMGIFYCSCGWEEAPGSTWDDHLAAALVPVVVAREHAAWEEGFINGDSSGSVKENPYCVEQVGE